MDSNEVVQKRELLKAHQKRLFARELQAAKYGVSVDPSIKIEIDEIKEQIANLEQEINNILERDRLGENLSHILREQNITPASLALNSDFGETIKEEIKHTIETVLRDMLRVETKIPGESIGSDQNPKWYLEMAQGFSLAGDWSRAAKHYDKYVEYNPYDWEVQFVRAVAYQNSRAGYQANLMALRAISETIALAPKNLDMNLRARLHGYRGAAFKRLDRLDEAESELLLARKWARENYEISDISYNLACIYAMSYRKKQMLEQLGFLIQDQAWKNIIKSKREYFSNYWHDPDFQRLVTDDDSLS